MTLEEQIEAMRARLEQATGEQAIALNERTFNRDSFELINDVRLKWIDKQMEVEVHIAEMLKLELEHNKRSAVARAYRAEMKSLKQRRRELKTNLQKSNGRVQRALRVLECDAIETKHRVSCWLAFSKLTRTSPLRFELGSSHQFYRRAEVNKWEPYTLHSFRSKSLTMNQLSKLCRDNALMVDSEDAQFQVIQDAFVEIGIEQKRIVTEVTAQMTATTERLVTTIEAQRPV